ncbi:sigma-54-dependent transcriptional regulator [Desulfosarcina sp.]|uniref:sigma-54-dependent transcriptional regulator n=1 Tax=Desulfosarcina sp. TaxID=2027861 RepID=UPI0035656522
MLVIMFTAYEDIATVVLAMKRGAYDYVVKPLHMDSLEVTIKKALETIKLRKEVQTLQARYLRENLPCFIGESRAILDVMDFIEDVAKSPGTPVLLIGATGTGKELIASSIHYRSPHFQGPLAVVNCAAIPTDLIESELFGYEKGAFSGAQSSGKKGLIEEAADGTLFLDKVGDLSLEAQAKLLRFLEQGEFYRLGGTEKHHIQTRVVSATNKNVEEMINDNRFRSDLYFRLGVIRVEIPSLNERKEDIIPLAKHFLFEFNTKFNKNLSGLSSESEKLLRMHNWTGNVRELKNLIERGVLIGKGTELTPQDLGLDDTASANRSSSIGRPAIFPPLPETGIDLNEIEQSKERYYIETAYKMAKGNESKAAKLLGINHHTYRYRRKTTRKMNNYSWNGPRRQTDINFT